MSVQTNNTPAPRTGEPLPRKALHRRRLPQQMRARNTVDAIFEATERLAAAHEFDALNTRMIAERAGVSIGSLYQYFPTCEAILLAWYERVSTDAAKDIRLSTIEVLDRSLREALKIAIRRLLDIYTRNRLVLIDLPLQVPRIEQVIRYTSLEVLNRGNIRLYLSHHPEYDLSRMEAHVFYIETLIHALMRRHVRDAPEGIGADDLVEQICGFIMGYLEGQRVALPPGRLPDGPQGT
ncbi:TetR/AcrR family transcriptional regulator [Novosphingobium sp. ERN07]|uniref:TetR/AcrR family transcriptional regulator n=1 Tax=Novosphingobium sp. ERN07 TaxID=2726187 RepID=UPI0014576705|nr:TetR/AcrR family transcriptional regulator [Novosphingobium sp. ERN07]NLR72976.1 TetR/AcrR family transcriptional regulator [Novosphingobium sp. ERN07]